MVLIFYHATKEWRAKREKHVIISLSTHYENAKEPPKSAKLSTAVGADSHGGRSELLRWWKSDVIIVESFHHHRRPICHPSSSRKTATFAPSRSRP